MANSKQTWPYAGSDPWLNRDTRPAQFLTPDGYRKSTRSLAGPLRMGTEPRVGPRGGAVEADYSGASDMGMDRIEPRDFDPMGTARNRFGDISSDLIARQVRGRRKAD
jgi:hypothetical protein